MSDGNQKAEGEEAEASAGRGSFDVEEPAARRSKFGENRQLSQKLTRASCVIAVAQTGGIEEARSMLQDADGGKEKVGIGFWDAVGNLVIALVGSAVVVLPGTLARVGWVLGPILLVVAALAILECGRLMCDVCGLAERQTGAKEGSLKSYEEVAAVVSCKGVLMVSKNVMMLGAVAMFMTLVSSTLAAFLPGEPEAWLNVIRFAVVTPIFILLAMVKDLKQLAKLNLLGIIAVAVECLGLLVGTLIPCFDTTWCQDKDDEKKSCAWYSWSLPSDASFDAMGLASSVFVFGFAVLATVPSIRSQMESPKDMPFALTLAMSVTLGLYLLIMATGYAAFGQDVTENLSVEISKQYPVVGAVTSLGLVFNLFLTAAIVLYCLTSVFEAMGTSAVHRQLSIPNIAMRASIVVVLALAGYFVKQLGVMIGLVASPFCVANNMFFPMIFYYKLRTMAESMAAQPPYKKLLHGLLAVFAAGVMVFGFLGALDGLKGEDSAVTSTTTATTTITSAVAAASRKATGSVAFTAA